MHFDKASASPPYFYFGVSDAQRGVGGECRVARREVAASPGKWVEIAERIGKDGTAREIFGRDPP